MVLGMAQPRAHVVLQVARAVRTAFFGEQRAGLQSVQQPQQHGAVSGRQRGPQRVAVPVGQVGQRCQCPGPTFGGGPGVVQRLPLRPSRRGERGGDGLRLLITRSARPGVRLGAGEVYRAGLIF